MVWVMETDQLVNWGNLLRFNQDEHRTWTEKNHFRIAHLTNTNFTTSPLLGRL